MPASVAAAVPAKQMVKFCKHEEAVFPVIVQSLHQQLGAYRKFVGSFGLHGPVKLFQALFTKTSVMGLSQVCTCFRRYLHRTALAVSHIPYFAFKAVSTSRTVNFFVFHSHHSPGGEGLKDDSYPALNLFAAETIFSNASRVSSQCRVFNPQSGFTHN